MLKDNPYVDNGLPGSNNLATAIESQQQLVRIVTKHGFNCRKWSINHPQLLQNIVSHNFDAIEKESMALLRLSKVDYLRGKVKVEPTGRAVCSDLAT